MIEETRWIMQVILFAILYSVVIAVLFGVLWFLAPRIVRRHSWLARCLVSAYALFWWIVVLLGLTGYHLLRL